MKANLSIWGMYQYNDTLFDDMYIPTQLDRQTLVDNILLECNEMQILYTNWSFLKSAIDAWSKKSLPSWQKIANTLELEYNPIENYDRMESWTDTARHTGTVTDQGTGSESTTREDSGEETKNTRDEWTQTLEHEDEKNENLRTTRDTEGTVTRDQDTTEQTTRSGESSLTHDGDTTDTSSKTGSSSMHRVATDTADDTTTETDANTTTNSVNGFNGTLSDQSMSPHDKSVTSATIQKLLDHDGTNEYTDTGSSTEAITASGTNDYTDESETSETANVTGALDYTDTTDMNEVTVGVNKYTDESSDSMSGQDEGTEGSTSHLESEESRSRSDQNTRTNNLVDTLEHTARIHGNIGTVTAQMMVTQQLELDKINLYDIITNEFKMKFCLNVYY